MVSRIATGAEFAPFDVQRARRTVTQLLWSVAPKQPSEIAALAAELPQLIADLSRGLSFIALSGAERELFFSELLAWHGAAIDDAKRLGRTAAAQSATVAAAAVPRPEPRPASPPSAIAGRKPVSDDPAPTSLDDEVARLGLTNGSEIEVSGANGETKRFKVGWMSPSRSVFIFSRYPRDHWTVRRPMLNALLAEGRIRLVGRVPRTGAAIESLKSR